jgi:Na+/phosphate symporter
MKRQKSSKITYIIWMFIVAFIFGGVSYYFFKDLKVTNFSVPWIFVSFFLFPFAYLVSAQKDLSTLNDNQDITQTESSRLELKIIFARKFLLAAIVCTVLFALISGTTLYYTSFKIENIKYSLPFVMSLIGINLYIIYSVWHLNNSISKFKNDVIKRKNKLKQTRTLQDKLKQSPTSPSE